jgi:LAO/AO transport system kinase
MTTAQLLRQIHRGDRRALARAISLVENDSVDAGHILEHLKIDAGIPVTGITGPPGAGKSTLVNALITHLSENNPDIKIAVLAVDPTSPFTKGSLLGDRLRMTGHFNNSNIYIRSLATRGALGGLSAKTIQITDVLRASDFDHIFIETVGVGQSEVEIAALADTTVVVLVPESGDEVQTIKSGIMEIADIFVVNKSDRDGADTLVKNLSATLRENKHSGPEIPIIKTVASSTTGIPHLADAIEHHRNSRFPHTHHPIDLLFQRALRVAEGYLLRKYDLDSFKRELLNESIKEDFNLYRFVSGFFK